MKKIKVYLAGPIFTYGDLLRNTEWAAKLRKAFPNIDLYSPVENTTINGVEGKKKFAGSKEIAMADNARLDDTDILIACIDGDVLPSGTCAEIGKFHEKIKRGDGKCLIGICTDNRQCFLTHSEAKDKGGAASLGEQQYSYQNLYVTGLIKEVGSLVYTIEEVIEKMQDYLEDIQGPKIPRRKINDPYFIKRHPNLRELHKKEETLNDSTRSDKITDDKITLTVTRFGSRVNEELHTAVPECYVVGYVENGVVGILKQFIITKEAYNRLTDEYLRHPIKFVLGTYEFTLSKKDIINEI